MAKKKASANGKSKKIPRQEALPGMENAAIKEIENAALDYVEGRDERMAATEKEVELKSALIAAMHKHEKTEYKRGRISVKLVVEKEKVKVRVLDEEEVAKQAAKKSKQTEFDPAQIEKQPEVNVEVKPN